MIISKTLFSSPFPDGPVLARSWLRTFGPFALGIGAWRLGGERWGSVPHEKTAISWGIEPGFLRFFIVFHLF